MNTTVSVENNNQKKWEPNREGPRFKEFFPLILVKCEGMVLLSSEPEPHIVDPPKNLMREYARPTTLDYRFLIPAKIVKSYKNMDITGQDVLDKSYIL